jgi:CubicO group peptidase (beta-lactamase class C family)
MALRKGAGQPGQRFAYNNAATICLPEVVRRLAGVPFENAAREKATRSYVEQVRSRTLLLRHLTH